jgi:hypothetical protein
MENDREVIITVYRKNDKRNPGIDIEYSQDVIDTGTIIDLSMYFTNLARSQAIKTRTAEPRKEIAKAIEKSKQQ